MSARIETIEGTRTLVVERRPPLPQKFPDLLGQLRDVTYRDDIVPGGMSIACQLREHRFRRFREGRHIGTDAVVRDVAIEMCADCGGTRVFDVSVDRLPGLTPGKRGPARRKALLGFYSGARRNGREFR